MLIACQWLVRGWNAEELLSKIHVGLIRTSVELDKYYLGITEGLLDKNALAARDRRVL